MSFSLTNKPALRFRRGSPLGFEGFYHLLQRRLMNAC